MKKPTSMGKNRTGIAMSPRHGQEMIDAARKARPTTPGDGVQLAQARRAIFEEAEPIGAVPPPTSLAGAAKTAGQMLKGHRPTVFIDRIAERLAFERSGSRLYEALITKFDAGGFSGGPKRGELVEFHREEMQHLELLKEAMEKLGADPTAQTPGADLVGVQAIGLMQTITDPRTTFPQSLHAILIAELADNDGWEMLIQLARSLGHDELASDFGKALEEEKKHLLGVRRWMTELTSSEAKAEMSASP